MDLYELIDYYLSLNSDSDIKKSIESNIYKRVAIPYECKSVFDYLIQRLDESEYKERQRIRKILLITIPHLNKPDKILFFNTFFRSRFAYDVESALSICDQIWEDSFNNIILEGYLRSGNERFMTTFLKFGNVEFAIPYLQQIWSLTPSNYIKTRLIILLCKLDFDSFAFLKDVDPEKYLMFISYSDKTIDDKDIMQYLNKLDVDHRPFGLMSLGRMKRWDILKKEIKKIRLLTPVK
ncbi:hypothetical protein SDC9_115179 [bioreactor metagenome]|uniref:Uncharacterized protein n=1 Tax=bioreactor metagenome TaxID=1076179 RepID=A0A645BT49_9ZZZZ